VLCGNSNHEARKRIVLFDERCALPPYPQTTPSERRSFVRFDVTMNTGPSARQQLAAKYEQLQELLTNGGGGGGGDVLPDAALVFVSAESCSKLAAASYDRSKAAEVATLSFDEETEALLDQLSKHQGVFVMRCYAR
jgi:hypothetical protein